MSDSRLVSTQPFDNTIEEMLIARKFKLPSQDDCRKLMLSSFPKYLRQVAQIVNSKIMAETFHEIGYTAVLRYGLILGLAHLKQDQNIRDLITIVRESNLVDCGQMLMNEVSSITNTWTFEMPGSAGTLKRAQIWIDARLHSDLSKFSSELGMTLSQLSTTCIVFGFDNRLNSIRSPDFNDKDSYRFTIKEHCYGFEAIIEIRLEIAKLLLKFMRKASERKRSSHKTVKWRNRRQS